MRRGRGILIALLAGALALAGCAGFPVAGPVNNGLEPGDSAGGPDFAVRPDSPQPGATPEQIVNGFLRAGSGPGTLQTWSVAREFLAPGTEWDPQVSVTIDAAGERSAPIVTEDGAHVELTIAPVAVVDSTGAYGPSDAGTSRLPFELEQVAGEWRITRAPDGIVLDSNQFPSVFRAYALQYFDPTWTYLVPDVRWFTRSNVRAQIAEALLDGAPSPWLAQSVTTAFPEGAALAQRSVPLIDGVAQVELTPIALEADSVTRDRMQTQLVESLKSAGAGSVQMSVDRTLIEAQEIDTRTTRVAALPLVLVDAGFGFLAGEELTPIEGLSEAVVDIAAVAIQVSPDRDAAAVRLAGGEVGRATAEEGFVALDVRTGLVDPSIDTFGFVWSVPHATPSALVAFAPDGTRVDIANAFPMATQITSMSVSHDGTRIAALVTSGGRTSTWTAGIVRDDDGVPRSLSDVALLVGWAPGIGQGLAWIDDVTLGVLAATGEDSRVLEQTIGGPAASTTGEVTATSIAGGNTTSPVRLRTSDGQLLIKRGANWQQTASDIRVLATQQGLPQ